MSTLQNITDCLLARSQDAIQQLEAWLEQQQDNINKIDKNDKKFLEKATEEHNMYIAQLNSLYMRSKYVRDKLECNASDSKYRYVTNNFREPKARQSYIEDLVFEFKDLTQKLNDLANDSRKLTINDSPVSQSTRGSNDSFEPKPLKILQRGKKNIISIPKINNESQELCEAKSLPNSLADSNNVTAKKLRSVKSYQDGLTNYKLKVNPFKENNRLSLSIFETMKDYSAVDSESDSDQDTILQTSPSIKRLEPLRKFNSHESILSKVNTPTISKPLMFYPIARNIAPSMQSADVNSNPFFSKPTLSTTSKELLTSFVDDSKTSRDNFRIRNKKNTDNTSKSMFSSWKLFGNSSAVVSEVGHSKFSKRTSNIRTLRRRLSDDTLVISTIVSTANTPKVKTSLSPSKQPIFNKEIRHADLQDALKTEFLL